MQKLEELNVTGKRVLIREDLNVPVVNGRVTSDARIRAALPTLQQVVERGGKLMVMSHLGRPEEGKPISEQPEMSLAPVVDHLRNISGLRVKLVENYLGGFEFPADIDLVVFENIRINKGEKANDPALSKQLAALCDIFVMDAFGTAHRAQSSTAGISEFAPVACAGPLLVAELDALSRALDNPASPVVAIVGGSKVSTKLQVLSALIDKVDHLVVGGGIANTFIAAMGVDVGQSLYEAELIGEAEKLMATGKVPIPGDVVVAKEISDSAEAKIKQIDKLDSDDMILDIGPQAITTLESIIGGAKTIIWNGPVGVFEYEHFAAGTRALTRAIAASDAFSIAGGGDTLAAIDQFGVADDLSYISTGGGAFLEFVEGKVLPAVAALEARG